MVGPRRRDQRRSPSGSSLPVAPVLGRQRRLAARDLRRDARRGDGARRDRRCGSRSAAPTATTERRNGSPRDADPQRPDRRQRERGHRDRVVRGPRRQQRPRATSRSGRRASRSPRRSCRRPTACARSRSPSPRAPTSCSPTTRAAWSRPASSAASAPFFRRVETIASEPTFFARLRTAVTGNGRAYVAWAAQLLTEGGGAARASIRPPSSRRAPGASGAAQLLEHGPRARRRRARPRRRRRQPRDRRLGRDHRPRRDHRRKRDVRRGAGDRAGHRGGTRERPRRPPPGRVDERARRRAAARPRSRLRAARSVPRRSSPRRGPTPGPDRGRVRRVLRRLVARLAARFHVPDEQPPFLKGQSPYLRHLSLKGTVPFFATVVAKRGLSPLTTRRGRPPAGLAGELGEDAAERQREVLVDERALGREGVVGHRHRQLAVDHAGADRRRAPCAPRPAPRPRRTGRWRRRRRRPACCAAGCRPAGATSSRARS